MKEMNLILVIPQGGVIATSLGIEGYASHRTPGSGKYFTGRAVFFDLTLSDGQAEFKFLNEGGWRDSNRDTAAALDAVKRGKRTKTALSYAGFGCTPISAYRACYLVKTGGKILQMERPQELLEFPNHECNEELSTNEVARAIGRSAPEKRIPRIYMVLAPTQLMMLSNLTPEEYAWYATHRPGKIFRQVAFTELGSEQLHIAAESRFENARRELLEKPTKKTKTITQEDCINKVPFREWVGYKADAQGGLYTADRDGISLWRFPATIPRAWEKTAG